MSVRHPMTGLALCRAGGETVDATFQAQTSVSAVWALGSPELREQIEAAHEHAIDQALAYALQWVPLAHDDQAADLIATGWRHTTARPVKDQPPVPHLHSHVLLHAARGYDGQPVAIAARAVFEHRRELGAAYRTELAHGLSQLGFEIQRHTGRGGRYFEIAGVPAGLLDHWSPHPRC